MQIWVAFLKSFHGERSRWRMEREKEPMGKSQWESQWERANGRANGRASEKEPMGEPMRKSQWEGGRGKSQWEGGSRKEPMGKSQWAKRNFLDVTSGLCLLSLLGAARGHEIYTPVQKFGVTQTVWCFTWKLTLLLINCGYEKWFLL